MDEQAKTNPPVRLKALLRERHWQTYRTFSAEYDKAARKVDPSLVGRGPSRAQLHRWISGDVKKLPYPDHCRVLEKMFPGWTAEQLFERVNDEQDAHQGVAVPAGPTATTATLPIDAAVAPSPISIRPYVEAAFDREHVAIDFFGFSGETLHGVIQEPLDKIRAGQLKPQSLTLRILVPDVSKPMAVPCRSDDLGDDPEFRERATRIMLRHGQAILDSVEELADLGILDSAKAEVRVHDCPPLFKLYIVNNEEVFFGFYPIRQHVVQIKGTPHPMFDLMGKEASLFRHTVHDGSAVGAQYVTQARQWFNTVWETISREFTG
ncbi:hypothetical protein [Actinoallomurus sp. NPDC052274]|uniref:hypothetical protein n=1 Tax=Actinoallomurus sp. NPDC052274 TaxID=3155420 RepID=UPI003412D4B6